MFKNSTKFYIGLAIGVSIFLTGCFGGKKTPNLQAIFAQAKKQEGKRPVIIIPGILGSELVNAETQEKVWLNFSVSKTDGLDLPMSANIEQNKDGLVARRIIEKTKVFRFLPEVSIYQALIRSMENYGGYKEGDWENPAADGDRDTFYVFAYDWRRDNVENARLLTRKMVELKQKLGKPTLRFNVIAHSMGGLVARYAAMYGDEDLPADGEKPAPTWVGAKHLNKIFMFGTPNEGSMSAFESLLAGYYVPLPAGRLKIASLTSETAFSSPAIFELLPHQVSARFYDENLKPLDVDLYDPETWKKYGWGAIAKTDFINRFNGQNAGANNVDAYFAAVLKRAKRFQESLDTDIAVPSSISLFTFGSDCDQTLAGAILRKDSKTGRWTTSFSTHGFKTADGRKISEQEVRAALYAPGDSRVTRTSLLAENVAAKNYRNSTFKKSLPVAATFFCENHGELTNNKIVQDNFLTALITEVEE